MADIIDQVTYNWKVFDDQAERTRKAFVNLFDPSSEDARLVAKFLVGVCAWENEAEENDPILNAKQESLRGVIRKIKKQLNMGTIKQ